uniref:Uncharacterized protein n=1 Tax=Desertifilum tharense IPPAS B-1220 TaxID=1781255 RepID=A0ACD5GPR0_9CYAN
MGGWGDGGKKRSWELGVRSWGRGWGDGGIGVISTGVITGFQRLGTAMAPRGTSCQVGRLKRSRAIKARILMIMANSDRASVS